MFHASTTGTAPGPTSISSSFTLRRRRNELRVVVEGQPRQVDEALLKNVATAQKLYEMTKQGISISAARAELGLTKDQVKRLSNLMFLSPAIIDQSIRGGLTEAATARRISHLNLPASFEAQNHLIHSLV